MDDKKLDHVKDLLTRKVDFSKKSLENIKSSVDFEQKILGKENGCVFGVISFQETPFIIQNVLSDKVHCADSILNTDIKLLHYYTYSYEKIRKLYQIILFMGTLSRVLRLQFSELFETDSLQFLIQSPKPTWENDISEILETPEITVEEYEKQYYQKSIQRFEGFIIPSKNESESIAQSWLPKLEGEKLIEFMTYLFPIGELKHKGYIAEDTERMWFYIFSWMLWYKFRYKVARIYEHIEEEDFSEVHELLQGKRIDSQVGEYFREALELEEGEYSEVLKIIQEYYQKQMSKRAV